MRYRYAMRFTAKDNDLRYKHQVNADASSLFEALQELSKQCSSEFDILSDNPRFIEFTIKITKYGNQVYNAH